MAMKQRVELELSCSPIERSAGRSVKLSFVECGKIALNSAGVGGIGGSKTRQSQMLNSGFLLLHSDIWPNRELKALLNE